MQSSTYFDSTPRRRIIIPFRLHRRWLQVHKCALHLLHVVHFVDVDGMLLFYHTEIYINLSSARTHLIFISSSLRLFPQLLFFPSVRLYKTLVFAFAEFCLLYWFNSLIAGCIFILLKLQIALKLRIFSHIFKQTHSIWRFPVIFVPLGIRVAHRPLVFHGLAHYVWET